MSSLGSPRGGPPAWQWGAPVLLIGAALLLYRPWWPRPFDIVDFAEFLPFLVEGEGITDRFVRFVRFYAGEHGRLNVVSYAGLVLKWELLGSNVAMWQWLRVGQMLLVVAGVHLLLRRLGASALAAAAGASLYLVSRPSAEGWTRLTLGEPLGLLLMLGALLLATGWRADPSRRRGLAIAGLVVASIFAKETLAGLAPLVWIVGALREEDGALSHRPTGREAIPLLLWSIVPALTAFGIAAGVALTSQGEGFTTLYGSMRPGLGSLLAGWQRPWQLAGDLRGAASWLIPANAVLALLSITGIVAALRGSATERRSIVITVACALGLGLAYAVLYLPWPFFYQYYAMPFLLGPSILLAAAVTAIERQGPIARGVALAAWVAILFASGSGTARWTHLAISIQQTHGDVIGTLAPRSGIDTILVARRQVAPYRWIGTGPSLRSFALASGATEEFPVAIDRECPHVARQIREGLGPRAVVAYINDCGPLPVPPSVDIRRVTAYLEITWGGIRVGRDTMGADILLPPTSRSLPPRD